MKTQAFASISTPTLHQSLSYFLDTASEAGVLILLVMSPTLNTKIVLLYFYLNVIL